MNKLTIEDVHLGGRKVLMRVDFNVPLEDGKVVDDKRIRAALPTIRYVIENGGRLVLMSHLGRPKGRQIPDMSLKPCVGLLNELLSKDIGFVDDCIGEDVNAAVNALGDGDILLLENLRYHQQETDNDPQFAEQLSRAGEIFVNDAFGTAHRAHASTVGVTSYIDRCVAGYLMMKEIDYLGGIMDKPAKPFMAILGGAKISGKIDVIASLLPKVERVIIGGGMAYTFLKANGLEIGNSLLEEDKIEVAEKLLNQGGDKIVLPVDCIVSDHFDFDRRTSGELNVVRVDAIPAGWTGLDIGPATLDRFYRLLEDAKTIVWNGPMGVFEIEETARGTHVLANMLAELTDKGATTVIGGGDSAAAVKRAGVEEKVSHVSTGGGASLELLEGKILPGIAALTDK
jgi:phosphoglycerate kinase